ncbi:hypothetical protein FHS31_000320 [Sphingomonas vulcanisoli]|uniref:Uncharacterized protein n=1 Tax=Sphingomonas vulcanisoli TaxID=1658060 RepID=A0ABX0TNQ3_9SPHN|nr:hypothetical protein [Sphingomonas vulcanisoli]NIJ06738.1 hypothetical protein [Sphingomonas vulcanisoli]
MIRSLLFAGLLAASGAAQAQSPAALGASPTGQPTAFQVTGLAYAVDGYGKAKWGMTTVQASAQIAADFPGAKIDPPVEDPVLRTTLIVAHLPKLAPGPGPAAVSYIFGWRSKGLMHVNVDWSFDHAVAADRATLTEAAKAVVADFISYYWKFLSVERGIAVGPNALSLFGAAGVKGGLVEVRLQGVGYQLIRPDGSRADLPPPSDGVPAILHIGFAQSATPDIYRIQPGDF